MIIITLDEAQAVAKYVGAVRVATQYLDEVLVDEDEIQKLEEFIEEFLNDRGIFV